ncbi:helix-turn-helix domain-containing protein [Rhodococcus qingshengii]|uniref:helix-turn-helix domain-containing protein n=1 Tax=Rhodococcus qingshengii TaxID=334542 RepID=UPI00380104D9
MATTDDDHLQQLAGEFGDRVRRRRDELDLTQEAASVVTGISVTTYQKIENGHRMPRLENVVKLIQGLELEPNALFGGLGGLLPERTERAVPGRRRRSSRLARDA